MSKRGLVLSEKFLIIIVLFAGLFGLYVMLDQTGALPSASSAGVTGFAAGEFSTAEEPLSATPVINQPPTYLGGSLTTQQDVPLAVDLATLFADPESDALTFLATQEDQVAVEIADSLATFTPAAGFAGERTLTIIVSDGANLVRQPVRLVVEGTAALEPAEPAAEEPVLEEPVAEEPAPEETIAETLIEEPAPEEQPAFGAGGFTTMDVVNTCPATVNTSTVLTQNLTSAGTCLTIAGDNLVLDCAGFNITFGAGGGSANGIVVRNRTNVTITGCLIRDSNAGGAAGIGVNFTNTTNSSLLNTTIFTNGTSDNYGVLLQLGTNNVVIANTTIFARGTTTANNGIRLTTNVTGVLIENSTIVTNGTSSNFGVYFLTFAQNSTVRNTSITSDGSAGTNIGVRIESAANRNVIANNTIVTQRPGQVNNYGINLITGVSESLLDGNVIRTSGSSGIQGIRMETGVQNSTVSNNDIATRGSSSSNFGIYLVTNANNNTIIGNVVNASGTSSTMGIRLESTANNNTVANNVVRTNGSSSSNYGIHLVTTALNNSIVNNTVSANGTTDIDGIRLESTANNNLVVNNTVLASGTSSGNRGIVLFNTALNNQVINNSVQTNGTSVNYGILLILVVDNNTLILNSVTTAGADSYGVRIDSAQGITLMNNSVVTATDGLFIEGTEFIHFTTHNITADNTINGSLIQYYGGAGQSPACPDNSVLNAPTTRHFAFINCVNVTLENYDAYDVVTLVNAKNLTVSGSRFRDNKYGLRVLDGTGLLVANSNFTGNTTTFTDNYGIFLSKTAQNSTIRGSNATTFGSGANNYGIYMDGNSSNNTIADGFVQTGGTTNNHGIRIEDGSNNVTVMNMTVRTGGTSSNFGIVAFTSVSGTRVENTTIMTNGSSSTNYGVYLLTFAQNSTIINNTIVSDGAGTSNGVRIEGASNRNVVANNTIIAQRPGQANNIGLHLITGVSLNRIDNNTVRASGSSGIQGVRLETGAQNNTVSNNYVATLGSSSSNFGIYLVTNANNNTIIGNVVNASGTSSAMGIRLESAANNNTVANNVVRTNGSSSSNYGIYLVTTALNNSIENNTVSANGTLDNDGIRLESTANNNMIVNNTVFADGSSNNNQGIALFNSASGNQIVNNTIRTNGTSINYGIFLITVADNNTLILNNISVVGADSYGVRIEDSQGVSMMNNSIETPYDGLFIESSVLIHFNTHNITADNLVNGSPIQYYGGPGQSPACPNNTILSSPSAAHIDFIGCGNITLTGYNAFEVVTLVGANNITINHSQSMDNKYGFRLLFGAGGNTIANNNISANTTTFTDNYGILLATLVHNNTVAFNNITTMGVGANNFGIWLFNASNNTVVSNSLNTSGTSNNQGIRIQGRANNNTVVNNTVNAKGTSSANYGILLFTSVSDNVVVNNTITTNGTTANYGIYLLTFAQNSTVAGNVVVAEGTSGSNNGIRLESASNANMVANNTVTVGPPGTTNNFGIQAVTGIAWNTIASNVVLARGSTGAHGIVLQAGAQNSTVANNMVTSSASSSGTRGIYLLTTMRNNSVVNNTVSVSGTSTTIGIAVESTANNITIANNTIMVNASSSTIRGILFDTTVLNSNITGNVIAVNGTTGVDGILLDTTANNNLFDNNNISVSGTSGYGIEFITSAGNQFNRTVLTNPVQWLQSGASSTNNFTNTTFAVPGNGSITIYGTFQLNATREISKRRINLTANNAFLNSTNLTFLNQSAEIALFNVVTGDPSPAVDFEDDGTFESCTPGAYPFCTELSYAGNVYVFNTTGFTSYTWTASGVNISLVKADSADPVAAGAALVYAVSFIVNSGNASNVTLTDTYPNEVIFQSAQPTPITGTNNTFVLGNLTSGTTVTVNISVFVPMSAAGIVINNTANASFQNETGTVIVLNVTESTTVRALPAIAQVILNSTNPLTNDTSQNLTLHIINVSHTNNFTVRNITDFRVNGRSIAVVNMPFETNTTGNVSSGAIRDYGTFGSHGTPGGGTAAAAPNWTSPGMVGGALKLDGNDDYVIRNPMNSWPTHEITVAFWMNSTNAEDGTPFSYAVSGSTNEFIILNYQNFEIYINGVTTGATGVSANNGLFQHIVVAWNSVTGNLSIYKNGTPVFSTTHQAGIPMSNGGAMVIGQEQDAVGGSFSAAQAFDGVFDELLVFNRTLTPAQVAQLYNDSASGRPLSVIVSQETELGQVWSACATPNDNMSDGSTVCSNNLTIVNYPPSIAQVILNTTNPLTNDTNQNLTAFIINGTDFNNAVVQNITDWRVDGVSIAIVNMPFDNITTHTGAEGVRDYGTFGNNGTLGDGTASQAPNWNASGRVGGAYQFDNSNDVIRDSSPLGLNFSTTNEFTAMAWINFTPSGFDFWLTLNNALGAFPYRLGSNSGGNPYWNMGGSGDQSFTGFTFGSNTWYHVAFVGKMNGSTIYTYIYVNGTLIHTQNSAVALLPNITGNILVGTGENIGTHPFNGLIDELQVYKRALTDEQINLSFQAGLAGRRFTVVDQNETETGENWTMCATPNNNQTDGSTVCSNNVTILEVQAPGNNAPSIAQVILNTTDPSTNDTTQNLTAFIINATDANNDVVQNITDWRRNGTSIAVLNLPFENNTLNLSAGYVRDYSLFGNNATLGGGSASQVPRWVRANLLGGGYLFNGSDDMITVEDAASLKPVNNISIEFWMNLTGQVGTVVGGAPSGHQYILHKPRVVGSGCFEGYTFTKGSTNVVGITATGSTGCGDQHSATTTSTVDTGRWYHVVGTFDGQRLRIYLNGTLEASTAHTSALSYAAAPLVIGQTNDFFDGRFNGTISEVRIYNRNLSDEQIRQLFNDGIANRRPLAIVSQETLAGDVWQICATPNDNQTDGSIACSNNVTIHAVTNAAPAIAQVVLNSTNPLANDTGNNLTLFVINATDANNDTVQNITDWRRNGTSIAVVNMPFENNTNNVSTGYIRDYSQFGNNATLGGGTAANAPAWNNSGKIGGDYVFDGVNDFISFAEPPADSTNLNTGSVFAWIRTANAGSSYRGIVVKPNAYGMFLKDNVFMIFDWSASSDRTTGINLADGQWHLVGFTFQSGVASGTELYIDGQLNLTTTLTISSQAEGLVIGAGDNPGTLQQFAGQIDDVMVFNRTLTLAQINQLYRAGIQNKSLNVIVAGELRAGEVWQACVTPNDNQTDGNTTCSNNVTIQQAPVDLNFSPSIAQVILNTTNPLTNDTNQNLTLFIVNATDADNDTVQNITDFRVNNRSIATLNWPFETKTGSLGTGAIRDYSIFGNNGTLGAGGSGQAPVWNNTQFIGGAYVYDGTDDYITTPNATSIDFSSLFTMEAWGFRATSAGTMHVLGKRLGCSGSNIQYQMAFDGSGFQGSGVTVNVGSWTHMVTVFNGTHYLNYLNGTLVGTSAGSAPVPVNADFKVGASGTCSFTWAGTLDEVRLYDRALSAAQVMQNYLDGNASRRVPTIVRQELNASQVWQACVTPNDNNLTGTSGDGNTTCSNNVTIQEAAAVANITSCPVTINASATLGQNLAGNGTCITIGASNLDLNCAGATIYYANASAGQGIAATGRNNVTVRNCVVVQSNASLASSGAILLTAVTNSSVLGNTVNTSGDVSVGIFLTGGVNRTTVANNTAFAAAHIGIEVEGRSVDNLLLDNVATGNLTGIHLANFAVNNTLARNNGRGVFGRGLVLAANADNNTLANNTFSSQFNGAIIIQSVSRNNTFHNTTLFSNATWLFVSDDSAGNAFANTTFAQENGSIAIVPLAVVPVSTNVSLAKLNVSFNRAFLNASNLSFLNATGVITLRGVTSADPLPLVDFEDDGTFAPCPATVCVRLSFAGGVLVFNTTRFSTYSSTEGGVNVTLTKLDSPDPVNASANLSYTIIVNVTSDSPANITLTDTYPNQTIFLTSQPAPLAGTNNTFIVGNLTNGTTFIVNITVLVLNVTNGTVINNTANISFQNVTGAQINVSVNESTTVLAAVASAVVFNVSNISVAKSDSPDPVQNGTLLSYVVNVTSNGNGTAYNVTVNDTYPNEVVFVSAQPTPITGTNNTFILGNLTNGTSVLVNITVNVTQVPNGTVLNNSVNVTFHNDTSALLSRTDTESTTTTNSSPAAEITGCPVTINTSTVLTQNLTSNLTCITFGASNIFLDCAGFTIRYGFNNTVPASGIVGRNLTNVTVMSCIVRDINATASTSPAINFSNVSNSRIANNTLMSNGTTDNYGIVLQFGSSFNTIANNTIIAQGTSSANYGVRIFTNATNNTIANNTIVSNGTVNSWAVYLATFVQNSTIVNNTLTADASSSGGTGIRLETSANNNLIANNTIVTRRPAASGNAGIFLFTATSNNQILNNSIRTNGTSNNGGITLSTTAQNNTVAYNLIFTGGSSSDNTGIQLTTNSHNNTVANNIVFTSGTVADDGVRIITTSNNNRVENNTLNVNGTSTFNRGVYVNAIVENTSIINNTITTGGVSSNDGIRLDTTVINTTIVNNTIIARGSAGPNAGINLLTRVNRTTVLNNTIFTNGTTTNYGIIIQSLSINNTIANNRINTSGTTTINYGIYLLTSAENNTIDNNTIIATGNGQSHGIRLEASSNSNTFFNNNITTNDTGYGVFILNSNRSSFVNTRFANASNWTSISANTVDNNFTNTTFEEGNRRLTYAALLTLNGAQDVTRHRLSLANNRVFLNGTNLTFLNRSAEIAYIGLSFDDPQVLIDREDDGTFVHCLFGFCNESSYVSNEFVFVVPGFTTYATAEGNTTLIKADSIDPAVPGELLTYRITVEVSGNNASNATITDLYPVHVAFNTSEPPPLAGTNDTFILGNLTSGTTRVVNITVLVLNGSLNGVVINNTVNISYVNSTGSTIAFNTTENTTLVQGCPGTITSSTTLGQNVTSGGTCVTFGTDNIFLDCAGFTITYGLTGTNDTSGINITSRNNSEVRNCVIVKGSSAGARTHAIGIFNSSNTRLENNTIRTNGTTEADGIHSGVANTSEIVFTPASVNIVTNNNDVNNPYCTNASGVSACQVCFDTGGVNCAFLGQGGCVDGEGFKFDELIRFNVSNNTNVTGGNIKIIGGEAVVCDVNEVRVLTLSTRNNCGTFRSATINASAFRTGPNNLTCQVAGGGKDEDNGFKLVAFSYDAIVTTSQSLLSGNSTSVTARNNTILADSTTKARGIFLDAPGSVVVLNNITNVGGDQSHGVVMGGENSTVIDNNITTYQGTGSNGVFIFAKNVTVTGNRVRASGDLQSVGVLVLANDSVVAFNNISTTTGRENRGISLLASNANVTANNVSVNAANESHGVYVGGSNNTVYGNNVSLNTSGLSHAILLEGGASRGNTVANNTLNVRGSGSDAIRVILSPANTIADNAIINASLSAVRVDRALNNVLLGTLPTTLSALLIIEDDGTINFTQPLTLSNATNLSQVVTIAFNFTRVNTTHSAGQQLNRSAILEILSLPTMGFRPMVDFEDDGTFIDCNSPQCRNATYNQTTGTLQMNVSSFTTYAGRAFPDCTTIDNEENQTTVNFTLEINLTATNTCFEIFGENVTLNCDNYTIFYDAAGNGADAIEIYNTSNLVIKNCIIRDVNRGGSFGIGINATIMLNHSEFFNNSIYTNGTFNNHGIALQGNTSNVTIRNNTIRTNGSSGLNFGIFMNGEADYVQIIGNHIKTNGSVFSGDNGLQFITRRFFYGRIENNSIDAGSTESGGSNFGMTVDFVNHTIFQGNYINTSPASNASGSNFGLVIFDGNNNTVQRNTVVTSGESSSFVLFFDGGSSYNRVLHNLVVGTTGDDHFGIFFDEPNTGNIIVNNTINLSDTDDNFGILMEPANHTLIENNTIITCCKFSNYGIIITDSLGSRGHNVTIISNNISTCCEDDNEGVIIEVDNSTVSNNTVTTCCSDSFNPGIWVRGGNATITGNVVRTNGSDSNEGIIQDTGDNALIAFNDVATRGFDTFNAGIDVAAANALIAWNNVTTNGTSENYGVLAFGTNVTIVNNRVSTFGNDTDNDAIYFGGSNSTAANNTVSARGNRTTGIFADGLFTTNDGFSVAIQESNYSGISILDNNISVSGFGSENHGIVLRMVNRSRVQGNRVFVNDTALSHGIFLVSHVSNSTMRDNNITVRGNESYAVVFFGGNLGSFGFNDTFEDGTLAPFTTDGNANWTVTTESALNSSFGVRAGNLTSSGQQSNLTLNLTLPAVGYSYVLQFAVNQTVSNSDRLEFYFDGVFQNSYSSNLSWQRITRTITSGPHTIQWRFAKFTGPATNYIFIDNIEILPLGPVSNNSFANNVLSATHWLYQLPDNADNTFTNTTFNEPNGSIRLLSAFTVPSQLFNVTKGKLNVTSNRAFLNSSNLSVMNVTGQIALRDITFPNPTPVFDFEDDGTFAICTSTADPFCTEQGYSGGVFVYNTSHFTTFSSVDQGGTSITLTKSDTPDPVNASAQLNYTVVVNVTSGNASNLTLTDVYPPQVIFLTGQPSPLAGTNNTFILGNVTNGTAIAVNITVLVLNITNGTVINNTANISFQNQTGGLLNQSVTESTTVLSAAAAQFNLSNVSMVKLDNPDPVNASGVLNYTIVVNATADSPANVTVTDTYPAQVIFLTAQPAPLAGTNNTFIVGNLTNGTVFTVNISVLVLNVSNGTVINNTANISFHNQTGATVALNATQSTTVLAAVAAGGVCPIVLNVSTTLTQNIVCNETAIIIANSSLTLDCAGFSVTHDTAGVGGDGIQSNNTQNVTVRDCTVRDGNASGSFGIGINFTTVNSSLVLNSTVMTNGTAENYGIFLFTRSTGNRVINNTIVAQGSGAANYGIYALANSALNNITGNTVRTNGSTGNYGIHIRNSSDDTIVLNNSISTQGDAETNVGVNVLNSSRMTITSNSIQTNGTFNNFGIILQFNVGASVVANNIVSTNGNDTSNFGIYLVQDVGANNVTGNTITTNGTSLNIGIEITRNATNTLVQNNTVATRGSATQNHAIRVTDSSFTNVTGNTVTTGSSGASTNQGIRAIHAEATSITQNTVTVSGTGSSAGITIFGNVTGGLIFNNSVTTGNGIFDEGIDILLNTSGVRVIGNTVVANGTRGSNGITLENDVNGNIVANNTITSTGNDTSFGIWLQQNASNNQLINNTIVTGGAFNNHGISIEGGSNDNRISFTTIRTTGSASYGISINHSNGTNFTNTRLVSTTEWIVLGAATFTNLTNTTFEQPNGSITVVGLAQANGTQNVTKAKLNITFNRAFLNSSNLSFLNVTGLIVLNGLASTDPQPIVDFEDDGTFADCTSTDNPFCTEQGYSGGVFTYNASHFTTYSSNETSAAAPAPSPGQGGGSGGGGAGGVRRQTEQPVDIISEVCREQWVCGGWSACANSVQSRECADLRACNTTYAMPALERACVSEVPEAEQPLLLLQPLKPFIALFRANLWLLVFVVLGIVFLTMASWQVGQYRGDQHYRPSQLPVRLPEHRHAQRPAGKPREKKHFYRSLDRLDRQLAELDKGKVPARVKDRLKPAELPRPAPQERPIAKPVVVKPVAVQPRPVIVPETPRRPGLFERLSRRISRKVEQLDRERTHELSEPHTRKLPAPKPVVLKPLRLPSGAVHAKDSKEFYHNLDALDKQLGRLERRKVSMKPVKPQRVEREPLPPKPQRTESPPVVKPARARPDAFERKLREAMHTKIDADVPKASVPRPVVMPKTGGLYDRIMKRMQKIAAAPEPRAANAKPASLQKIQQPKTVRVPSLQDIKRGALKARVKKSEDREDFRKKLRSFDDELDKLDKKMKKKAK